MNNEKLKIDLCGRLPYGVKVQLTCDWTDEFNDLIEDIDLDESIFNEGAVWLISGYCDPKLLIPMGDGDIDGFVFSKGSTYASFGMNGGWKPLIFPISSLTKPIQLADYNNGEPFVPLEEIAKIMFRSNHVETVLTKTFGGNSGWHHSHEFIGRGDTGGDDPQYVYNNCIFFYDSVHNFFHITEKSQTITHCDCVDNLLAFDLLNRWKIDYRGLINEGLAIEVNSENNPYL